MWRSVYFWLRWCLVVSCTDVSRQDVGDDQEYA
jgi:hypothetical protein